MERSIQGIMGDLEHPQVGTAEEARKALSAAGIPGIKYLDQGSRAAGDGSRNYVVFNPSLIEIMRKYGILAPVATFGAMAYGDNESANNGNR